jgi:hypothetical protein
VPGRLLHNFALSDFTVTDVPDTSSAFGSYLLHQCFLFFSFWQKVHMIVTALANAFRFTVKESAKAPSWATGKPLDVCTGRKSDKLEWIEALAGAQQRAGTP